MVSLREIRKRIHSVNNIKQITKAMEMVAGARLAKAEAKSVQSRLYMSSLKDILNKLLLSLGKSTHPLLKPRAEKNIGLVVVSGDRGLCGSYHSHLFSKSDKFLSSCTGNAELLLIGKKALGYYHRKAWHIPYELPEWGGKITHEQVHELSKKITESYLSGKLDAIWVIYTKFKTIMTREVVLEKLLNIEAIMDKPAENVILEPSEDEILEDILPRWLAAKLQNILDEAYASELAARVISMKTASKNAEEMIENLTLVRNRVRQENITKEISEIISGAEGLK